LKGVAGNIGAKPVQAAAGIVERLIREQARGDEMQAAKSKLSSELDSLLAPLRSALNRHEPGAHAAKVQPATIADRAQVQAAAEQLSRLLAEFDPGAVDFVEANQGVMCALFDEDGWAAFEKLVQSYAFADAQAKLEERLRSRTF
jgi:hypothetical protein